MTFFCGFLFFWVGCSFFWIKGDLVTHLVLFFPVLFQNQKKERKKKKIPESQKEGVLKIVGGCPQWIHC